MEGSFELVVKAVQVYFQFFWSTERGLGYVANWIRELVMAPEYILTVLIICIGLWFLSYSIWNWLYESHDSLYNPKRILGSQLLGILALVLGFIVPKLAVLVVWTLPFLLIFIVLGWILIDFRYWITDVIRNLKQTN
jgi:hypothetical protein